MDSYIDNQETQTYGDRFSGNLRRMFGDDTPKAVRVFMVWCADLLDEATTHMHDAMVLRRSASSERSAAAEEKLPVCSEARAELKAFALHLSAKKADRNESWNGDISLFFPAGMSGIRDGARALRDATRIASKALTVDAAVPERATWSKRLATQIDRLDPVVERTDEAGYAHNAAFTEQSLEKRSWLRVYRGVAMVLQGVLTLTAREGEYAATVPHLSAPGTRKATDGPPNVGDVPAPAPVNVAA